MDDRVGKWRRRTFTESFEGRLLAGGLSLERKTRLSQYLAKPSSSMKHNSARLLLLLSF